MQQNPSGICPTSQLAMTWNNIFPFVCMRQFNSGFLLLKTESTLTGTKALGTPFALRGTIDPGPKEPCASSPLQRPLLLMRLHPGPRDTLLTSLRTCRHSFPRHFSHPPTWPQCGFHGRCSFISKGSKCWERCVCLFAVFFGISNFMVSECFY